MNCHLVYVDNETFFYFYFQTVSNVDIALSVNSDGAEQAISHSDLTALQEQEEEVCEPKIMTSLLQEYLSSSVVEDSCELLELCSKNIFSII